MYFVKMERLNSFLHCPNRCIKENRKKKKRFTWCLALSLYNWGKSLSTQAWKIKYIPAKFSSQTRNVRVKIFFLFLLLLEWYFYLQNRRMNPFGTCEVCRTNMTTPLVSVLGITIKTLPLKMLRIYIPPKVPKENLYSNLKSCTIHVISLKV